MSTNVFLVVQHAAQFYIQFIILLPSGFQILNIEFYFKAKIDIFLTFMVLFFVTEVTHSWPSASPKLYNLETLLFNYDQYVVIEFADKLYNSVTLCFCVSPWIFIQINTGDWTTDPWITKPALYLYTMGTHSHFWFLC